MNASNIFSQLDYAVCVITGGSSGIGKEFISVFKENAPQMRIINLSRSEPDAGLCGPSLTHIPCDLGDERASDQAIQQVCSILESTSGKILLINNSGFGLYESFASSPLQDQLDMIAVNITAMLKLTHAALPAMEQRGGAIINLSSAAAFKPIVKFATYGATKSFELYWSLALAEELAPASIRVLAVCPQRAATAFFDRADPSNQRVPTAPPISAQSIAQQSLRALAQGKELLVFSKMDAARAAWMLPSQAIKRLRKTALFRRSQK